MCKSLAFLEALSQYQDPAPIPQALEPAAWLLVELGYHSEAVRQACFAIARDGTAQITSWLDEEDRDAVEELVPRAPELSWRAHDGVVISLVEA